MDQNSPLDKTARRPSLNLPDLRPSSLNLPDLRDRPWKLTLLERASSIRPVAVKKPDTHTRDRFLWLKQVQADPNLTPLCFHVAHVIATHISRSDGYAWPSQERIASLCHATDRGVRKSLTQLKNGGHLKQTGRGGMRRGKGLTCRYTPILKKVPGTVVPGSTRNGGSDKTFERINL